LTADSARALAEAILVALRDAPPGLVPEKARPPRP
jgi:hypothetical protein